jgi:hypothetical protein
MKARSDADPTYSPRMSAAASSAVKQRLGEDQQARRAEAALLRRPR